MTGDNREPITALDACQWMHTALRKACTSKASGAAYFCIHMLGFVDLGLNPWRVFGGLVAQNINERIHPEQSCQFAMTAFRDEWHERDKAWREKRTEADRCAFSALYSSLSSLSDRDWIEVASCFS